MFKVVTSCAWLNVSISMPNFVCSLSANEINVVYVCDTPTDSHLQIIIVMEHIYKCAFVVLSYKYATPILNA